MIVKQNKGKGGVSVRIIALGGDVEAGKTVVDGAVAKSLSGNGTYMPGIKSVVFSLKTERAVTKTVEKIVKENGKEIVKKVEEVVFGPDKKPVMSTLPFPSFTTFVEFKDGTRVHVSNSAADKVGIVEAKIDKDGNVIDPEAKDQPEVAATVKVADRASMERGIVFALVKRMAAKIDKKGNVKSNHCTAKLLKKILDGAVVQEIAAVQKKLAKEAEEKAAEEAKKRTDRIVAEEQEAIKKASARREMRDKAFDALAAVAGPLLEKIAADPAKYTERIAKAIGD